MAGRPTSQADFQHTWYLREWMQQASPPKRQADMVRQLNWPRAKASSVFNGQQYTQALIDELSVWLNVEPFELLLKPEEAMAIRRMKEAALTIVQTGSGTETEPTRTGTNG